ncbi:MAG: anti-sigma factor [Methylovirgula sp.]
MTADIDDQAAEYVLGTLSAEERAAFDTLLSTNEAARQAVAAWEQRLAPLGAQVSGVTPAPAVWNAIERALAHSAMMPQARQEPTSIHVLRRSRNRWRAATYLAGTLAAALAFFGIDRTLVQNEESHASYVAVVNRGGDQPALIIRVDLATNTVFVRPVATEVPQGHSLELWYIGQGKAPKPMGLVDKTPERVPLPAGANIEKANFAVTVEPEGGSPTGSPTGPIVYSGQLLKE